MVSHVCYFPFSGVDNGDRGHRRDTGRVHLSIPPEDGAGAESKF